VTGDLRIDDMGVLWDARLGDSFSSITGALHYTFSNTKLEPRDMADIAWLGKGSAGSISKCIEGDCQVPAEVPGTQEVVINEVMADPSLQDTGQEWIELYNPSNQSVDIYGWELRDCGDQVWKLTGPNLVMAPGSYLVLGMNSNTNTNGGLNVDLAYGDGFYLPNTVGSVLLFKGPGPGAQLVDQTRYMAFDPWNQFSTGHSLERIIPVSDGTVSESWSKGSQPYGNGENYGTPGKKNSATP